MCFGEYGGTYISPAETGLYYLQSRYYNPEMGRFINADDSTYLGADGTPLSYNLFAYCKNNPVMFSDPNGHAPEWWQWAISGAMVAVGVALVATGVGGVAGGALICAGANSMIGSYVSEATKATGAVCLGTLAKGGIVAFSYGAVGSGIGQGVSAAIDGKKLNAQEVAYSSMTIGAINCLSGIGAGIGTAVQGMPVISTTTTILANLLNAACLLISETMCDFLGTISSI